MSWFDLKTRLVIVASASLGLSACGRAEEAPPALSPVGEEAVPAAEPTTVAPGDALEETRAAEDDAEEPVEPVETQRAERDERVADDPAPPPEPEPSPAPPASVQQPRTGAAHRGPRRRTGRRAPSANDGTQLEALCGASCGAADCSGEAEDE